MLLNPKFEYPEIERVTNDDGTRYYVCPETQQKLYSVTTIISATEDKTFLKEWEERIGTAEADRQRKYGTDLGTLVHTHLECHKLGVERPQGTTIIRSEARRMADAMIANCLDGLEEVWGMETALYYPGLFAGTTDVVGVYKGKPAIMDYKTAKRMRKREQIITYRDQLAAYSIAHNEKYGTEIQHGVIFMVDRELNTQVFEYDAYEMIAGEASFLDRVEKYLNTPQPVCA